MEYPKVTLIIPCRNEEKSINKCIESILTQDYPSDKIEVFVVDGMSNDHTKLIVKGYCKLYPFINLLVNPLKIIPTAMNIGIKKSTGDIIMKIDAHTIYERNYVSSCVKYLISYEADNAGGLQIAIPRDETYMGKGIVFSISHPFGVGNAKHRLMPTKPVWADTAYSGCYRRETLERVGLYDERIARSEDVALHSKIREVGGKILLVPDIKTYYLARSNYFEFIKHNFDNGFWITYPMKYNRVVFSLRHLIPMIFVISLLAFSILSIYWSILLFPLYLIILTYLIFNIGFSLSIAIREKKMGYLFLMPLIFTTLHITYGLGSLWGLIKASKSMKLFQRFE